MFTEVAGTALPKGAANPFAVNFSAGIEVPFVGFFKMFGGLKTRRQFSASVGPFR